MNYIIIVSLCVGSFTVPQVFFNEEYIGDATKFNCCFETPENSMLNGTRASKSSVEAAREKCPCLYDKLRQLALSEIALMKSEGRQTPKKIAFPPRPTASMVKITEELAFSSQPTTKQLKKLKVFGFSTVVNLLKPNSPAFNEEEEMILIKTGISYRNIPFYVFNTDSCLRIISAIETMMQMKGTAAVDPPILVHDDSGQVAGLIVLFLAVKEMMQKARKAQTERLETYVELFTSWMKDMAMRMEEESVLKVVKEVLHHLFLEVHPENRLPPSSSIQTAQNVCHMMTHSTTDQVAREMNPYSTVS